MAHEYPTSTDPLESAEDMSETIEDFLRRMKARLDAIDQERRDVESLIEAKLGPIVPIDALDNLESNMGWIVEQFGDCWRG
jgi:hypothetical protein